MKTVKIPKRSSRALNYKQGCMIHVVMLLPLAASVVGTEANVLSSRSCEMGRVQIYCSYHHSQTTPVCRALKGPKDMKRFDGTHCSPCR